METKNSTATKDRIEEEKFLQRGQQKKMCMNFSDKSDKLSQVMSLESTPVGVQDQKFEN